MLFLDQSNRLVTVTVPGDPELTAKLVAERFQGSDYLSRDFKYDVLLISEDDSISLEDVQGRMMVVWQRRPDESWRPFTGRVKFFEFIDKIVGKKTCTYRATLVPWTDYAKLRRNCRVFLGKTREDQFQSILEDYRLVADWQWRIPEINTPRQHTMCVQFNESDWNYMVYRLELDGTPYFFEHRGEGPFNTSADAKPPGHTFVVIDDTTMARAIPGPSPEVPFHPDLSTSEQQYAITKWTRHAQWGHSLQRVGSYNFRGARVDEQQAEARTRAKNVLSLESYEFVGNYGFTNRKDGDRLAKVRMQEAEVRRYQMLGHSTNPFLEVGRWFRITRHRDCSDKREENEYVVSEIHYDIKNNFLNEDDHEPSFKNTFLCHPRKMPWRPGRGLASTPNVVTQVQTATVVGAKLGMPIGDVDVDEFGRVLIRFHWQVDDFRAQSVENTRASTEFTCRVRLQQPWVGGEQGMAFYPRIGSEVVVAFEMGNPDHPIIQGAVANTDRMPAWNVPSQSHLSGIRTRQNSNNGGNYPGDEGNHLLFDDTPGHLQWQAFSSHQYSELSLGVLAFIDGTEGRTRARGQGFELRTDGHGSERAARGLFKTTDARTNAISHATDIKEAAERLTNAQDLHGSLSDAAQTAGAHDAKDQAPVVKALQQQTTELKGSGGDPEQGLFPEFQAPHILTSSAAGIQSVAEGSTHIASNEHTALTTGGHTSISAGKSLLAA